MKILLSLSATGDVLYHKTHVTNVLDMLESGRIELTSAMSAQADNNINHGYQYYLSTARTLTGKYNYMSNNYVQLVLDRNKIKNNYRIEAVDYWGEGFRKYGGGIYEQEDRILSNKPSIPFKGIVKEVHLVHEGDTNRFTSSLKLISKLKRLGIKVYMYDNVKDAQLLNRRKAKAVDITNFKTSGKKSTYSRYPNDTAEAYMSLLKTPVEYEDKLSAKADRLRMSIRNQADFRSKLAADISNAKRLNDAEDLKMKKFLIEAAKLRLTSIKAIHEFLATKWGYRYY